MGRKEDRETKKNTQILDVGGLFGVFRLKQMPVTYRTVFPAHTGCGGENNQIDLPSFLLTCPFFNSLI